MKQPMQPIEDDGKGVIRFRGNALVRYLLDNGGIDLNALALLDFPQEDREQFAQLIGYSVSGFGDLSYANEATVRIADELTDRLLKGNKSPPTVTLPGYREGFDDGKAAGIALAKQALDDIDQ